MAPRRCQGSECVLLRERRTTRIFLAAAPSSGQQFAQDKWMCWARRESVCFWAPGSISRRDHRSRVHGDVHFRRVPKLGAKKGFALSPQAACLGRWWSYVYFGRKGDMPFVSKAPASASAPAFPGNQAVAMSWAHAEKAHHPLAGLTRSPNGISSIQQAS